MTMAGTIPLEDSNDLSPSVGRVLTGLGQSRNRNKRHKEITKSLLLRQMVKTTAGTKQLNSFVRSGPRPECLYILLNGELYVFSYVYRVQSSGSEESKYDLEVGFSV